jgi:hypothetical protein
MGKAKSDVIRNQHDGNYGKVHVQWWVLLRKEPKMMKNCIMIVG